MLLFRFGGFKMPNGETAAMVVKRPGHASRMISYIVSYSVYGVVYSAVAAT